MDGLRESELIEAARGGDAAAFGDLVQPYRAQLHVHCYRMLGSIQDAEDALQDALLGAWRGLTGFEARSSLLTWLHRIATNACLRALERRPARILAAEFGPARRSVDELGEPVASTTWLDPYPDDPEARYELRESVELAFVAALQHLPATQRAVLILREVLGLSAAEVAESLDTSVASVNSALQRARKAVDERVPPRSQQATLRELGEDGRRELVESFVAAWERADVAAILGMLTDDVRFAMPPLPAWFDGRVDVGRFLDERVFATPWRLVPMRASGQLAFACYQGPEGGRDGGFRLGSLQVLTLRGDRIADMTAFLAPSIHSRFGLPDVLGPDR